MASEKIINQKKEEVSKLAEHYDAIMGAILKAKPAAAKGQYIRSVSVSTTMGPGLYINQK